MAELVDAKDLKSFGYYTCAGSSPALGTSLRSLRSYAWQAIFSNELLYIVRKLGEECHSFMRRGAASILFGVSVCVDAYKNDWRASFQIFLNKVS